jgi:hypothetical protein
MKKDAEKVLQQFNQYVNQVQELTYEGKEIIRELESLGLNQEAYQMKYYFTNRLQNFLDGNEILEFENVRESLLDIIETEDEEDE